MSHDDDARILERRARALARPVEARAERRSEPGAAHAVFEAGTDRFAIDARYVLQVERLSGLVPVPGLPSYVRGVTMLRGEVVAVIDLRILLGLSSRGLTDLSRLVVLGEDAMEIAVLVDRALEVQTLLPEEILPLPAAAGARDHVRGITREGTSVLDGATLLADPRLWIDEADESRRTERNP